MESDTFYRLSSRPRSIRDEVEAQKARAEKPVVIIDAIQKLPVLLDEVQLLIERYGIVFILSGASERKLVRAATNLLDGRARMRRTDSFARFLRTASPMNAELVNYEAVSSDSA